MKRSRLLAVLLPLMTLIACALFLTVSTSAEVTVRVSDGVMTVSGSGEMTDAVSAPAKADEITSVVIEDGVTSVGAYAFAECYNLTSVTIAPSVQKIGAHAFDGCESLVSFALPAAVHTIGVNAFFGCHALTEVTFGEGLVTVDVYAFSFCSSLTAVTLPDGVKTVGNYAFAYCTLLSAASLPAGTQVGTGAFSSCADGFILTRRDGGDQPDPSTGFRTIDGKLYYYEKGKVKTGWFVVDGKTYYGSSATGVCVNYDKVLGGKQYFWNDETGLVLANGFYEVTGGTVCYQNGYQVIGWRHTDGSGPVVDEKGISEQYSSSPNNLYYFLSTTGFMVTDSTYKLGGFTREFNNDHTVKPLNGLQNRYGELYYYVDGVIQTGWHTIDGNTYYFRASDAVYGRAATKWMYIGNKVYYFYASTSATPYALKTSGAIGGITYNYAEDGHILYNGFVNCEFANEANSNTAPNIQKKNGTTRYYVNGEMQTGWQQIGGKWYYFFAIGSSMGSGYMCVESRSIGGVWYEFNEDGVCTSK